MSLSAQDIAQGPVGFTQPLSVQFSPDGSLVSYLYPDSQGNRQVFACRVDSATYSSTPFELVDTNRMSGTGNGVSMSLQEVLRMERQRLAGRGLSSYCGAKEAPRMIPR